MREPAEPLQRGGHRLVASPAAGVTPVPVVGVGVAVDADADADIELVEEGQVGVAQTDAVGLHGRVNGDAGSSAAPGRRHQPGDQVPPGQQWLAAMQDQRDLRRPCVLACSPIRRAVMSAVCSDIARGWSRQD